MKHFELSIEQATGEHITLTAYFDPETDKMFDLLCLLYCGKLNKPSKPMDIDKKFVVAMGSTEKDVDKMFSLDSSLSSLFLFFERQREQDVIQIELREVQLWNCGSSSPAINRLSSEYYQKLGMALRHHRNAPNWHWFASVLDSIACEITNAELDVAELKRQRAERAAQLEDMGVTEKTHVFFRVAVDQNRFDFGGDKVLAWMLKSAIPDRPLPSDPRRTLMFCGENRVPWYFAYDITIAALAAPAT